jgi:hypothetical protein
MMHKMWKFCEGMRNTTFNFFKDPETGFLVPMERLELSRCYHRGILNPLRLPFRHIGPLKTKGFLNDLVST